MATNEMTARPLQFTEKLRLTAACAVTIALFISVGWTVIRPADPFAAVTLVLEGRPWPALLGVIVALSVVATSVATVVAGSPIPHAGVMATAVGLAVLATRGGTMTKVLMYSGSTPDERRTLAVKLILEVSLWAIAVAAAWFAESIIQRWLAGPRAAVTAEATHAGGTAGGVIGALIRWRDGLLGMAVCVAVAWILISLAISRTAASPIERGQVYFAVGVAFMAGAMAGSQLWPKGAAGWYVLSVAVVAVCGYAMGYVRPTPSLSYYSQLATTPPNALYRVLPIEYLSVGVIGSLAGLWFSRRLHETRAAAKS